MPATLQRNLLKGFVELKIHWPAIGAHAVRMTATPLGNPVVVGIRINIGVVAHAVGHQRGVFILGIGVLRHQTNGLTGLRIAAIPPERTHQIETHYLVRLPLQCQPIGGSVLLTVASGFIRIAVLPAFFTLNIAYRDPVAQAVEHGAADVGLNILSIKAAVIRC